jgi:hypothetical protein
MTTPTPNNEPLMSDEKEITRYRVLIDYYSNGSSRVASEESEDGKWVLYSDYQSALAQIREENIRLDAELNMTHNALTELYGVHDNNAPVIQKWLQTIKGWHTKRNKRPLPSAPTSDNSDKTTTK